LTAVDWTISSSNPRISVIFCSIHCAKTILLILDKMTFLEKLSGNFAALIALFNARESATDAVPLIEGMLCCFSSDYFKDINDRYRYD